MNPAWEGVFLGVILGCAVGALSWVILPPRKLSALKRKLGIFLLVGGLSLFWIIPPHACAGSGVCYSEQEFDRVKESLQASLGPFQRGIITWCVCKNDRGKILYITSVTRDTILRRPIARDFFAMHAERYGGCFKEPKQKVVTRHSD